MKILFLGRSEFLYNTIVTLSKEHDVCGIITSKASGEYTLQEKDYEHLARTLRVPFFLKNRIDDDILDFCKNTQPDLVLTVNWVSVMQKSFVDLFPLGVFNAHCGRLPDFKGNAIPNWCILMEEQNIPVNIHSVIGGVLDSGKIYKQGFIPLDENTTIKNINTHLAQIVPDLFKECLDDLKKNILFPLLDCTHTTGFRCFPRLPSYSKVTWSDTACHIHNLIRSSMFPYAAYCFYEYEGKVQKLYLLESEVISPENTDIAFPGHVLLNDKETGYAHIQTGKGVIALKKCLHDGENQNVFHPGKQWKSIRMNLSISVEDYMYKIFQKMNIN